MAWEKLSQGPVVEEEGEKESQGFHPGVMASLQLGAYPGDGSALSLFLYKQEVREDRAVAPVA